MFVHCNLVISDHHNLYFWWSWYTDTHIDNDDVIKWKHIPRHWPFVRVIHRSPVNSTHIGQWRGALMFSLICAWVNGWVNNREVDDLRRHRAHYNVIVMMTENTINQKRFIRNIAKTSSTFNFRLYGGETWRLYGATDTWGYRAQLASWLYGDRRVYKVQSYGTSNLGLYGAPYR